MLDTLYVTGPRTHFRAEEPRKVGNSVLADGYPGCGTRRARSLVERSQDSGVSEPSFRHREGEGMDGSRPVIMCLL
jgi:hypothetical protein